MRVTDAGLTANLLRALQTVREQSATALEQLADGKRVRYGSDDALAASLSLGARAQLVRIEGYRRTSDTLRADLNSLDAALSEATDLLERARVLAVSGGSDSTSRQSLASEVDALRDQLLSVANIRQNGRYLFAGSETLTRPYETDGTYQGNGSASSAEVDDGIVVESTVDGELAFAGVFDALQQLSDALNADDGDAVRTIGAQLETFGERLSTFRGQIGNRLTTLDSIAIRLEDREFALQSRVIDLENIDIETVATNLSLSETGGAALSAAASRVLGRSLFDFLA